MLDAQDLQAIADLIDAKLDAKLAPIQDEIRQNREAILSNTDAIRSSQDEIRQNREAILSSQDEIRQNREAILSNTEAIRSSQDEIRQNREAILSSQDEIRQNREAILSNTEAIRSNQDEIRQNREAILSNTEAIRSNQDEIRKINVTLENMVFPQLQVLAEGQQLILETLAPKNRVEALEDEVVFLKQVIKSISRDVSELKKAQ